MTEEVVSDSRSFTAGGMKFKLLKINALDQFHIFRKIGPIIGELLPALGKVKNAEVELNEMTEEEKLKGIAEAFSPILNGLARLSDKDSEFVLFRLLSSVEVEQASFGNWTRVATNDGIKIQTIEMPILMQAAGRALMYNLSGFLAMSPRK